jgi:MerR family transcriptional regulator, mercuric resistance operon regulatory protein
MTSHRSEFYIGSVAKLTGVKIETIRYYEKAGILNSPNRNTNGYRLYTKTQIEQLMFVKRCRELGFSLEHTTSLLNLADNENRTCKQISAAAGKRLKEVRTKISDLQRMETVLENYVDACPRDASADCPIVKSLSHVENI